VVTGEMAAVPLALGLSYYALAFSIFNAAVLAIRIPAENAALAGAVSGRRANAIGAVGGK
jgi:methyltransferase